MGLTKEECQIAWNTIKDLNDYPIQCTTNETQDKFQMIPFVELFSNEIALIDSLLKQHFDNLPLKREEIHEMVSEINKHDVVIFDDEDKCYIRLYLDQEGILYFFHFGNECESLFIFEDNRFYRREVDSKDGK